MTIDRKNKPSTNFNIDFNLPNPKEFFLDNGLRVILVTKDKLPMIRMYMMINAGSKYDFESKNGLAYLTSLVMDEGADNLNALQLSDEFDLLGANFNLSTENDLINISLQSLTDKFENALELFSKVLLKPNFHDDDFEREKKKLITRILQSKDEPDYLADQIFDKIIFGNKSGYASPVSGYKETVETISVEDVKNFHKSFFSPSNSSVVVVGNISQMELSNSLNKYLPDWKNNNNNFTFLNESPQQTKRIYVYHKEDSVQTEIRVGHISPNRNNDDYFKRMLLNTILGGQFTSRINLNLRERNGYTYGATSRFQYYKDSAFFEVTTSAGIENSVNALKEILFELENIHNGVTDNEVEFAKSSITKKFPLNFETHRQISASLTGKILYNLPDNYFHNYINSVNSVLKSEINKAAKDFINNDNLSIVLIGDKNLILPKLSEIPIEVSEVNLFGDIV